MTNNVENTYEGLINFFEDIALNSNYKELTDLAKNSFITYAKTLCNLKNVDIKEFAERINKIDKKNISIKYNSNKEIDENILNTIYKSENKKMSDKFQKLVDKLIIDLKNPNELLITTWINNYNEFVNEYSDILDKEKMTEYISVLFNKYDKSGVYSNNLKKYIYNETLNENKALETSVDKVENVSKEENNVSLEIKNIKKSNLKPLTLKNLKRFSILKFALNLGIGTKLITYLYKKFNKDGIKNNNITTLLKKLGYNTEINDEVSVNKEEVEKEKYSFIKNKLIETNNKKDDGTIKKEYKKNKLASILLNSKIVESIRNKNVKKQDKVIINNQNELMYKGLGKC